MPITVFRTLASRAQVVKLLTLYKQRAAEGDPRLCDLVTGRPFTNGDGRDARLDWAAHYLGKTGLYSFNDLSAKQAEYLLDVLESGKTKIDRAIAQEFVRLAIRQPEEWFASMQAKSAVFKFQGLALSQLNRWQKSQLLSILRVRRRGAN